MRQDVPKPGDRPTTAFGPPPDARLIFHRRRSKLAGDAPHADPSCRRAPRGRHGRPRGDPLKTAFVPPRDGLALFTHDSRVAAWAERLWERGSIDERAIRLDVDVLPGPAPDDSLPERLLRWTTGEGRFAAEIGESLRVSITERPPRIDVRLAAGLLDAAPLIAARYALEVPVAVLLARRAFTVVHAAAVVGSRGAVVIRGAAGAGKSTLAAACWRSRLDVLSDDTLLVARDDPDDLAAAVRDLALLPDAAARLDVTTEPAFTGGEEKRRVDLLGSSTPARRRARRLATLLLGPRSPGPARLAPLDAKAFVAAFPAGEIPQERQLGNPDEIARRWAEGAVFRLDGGEDLDGAVRLVTQLAGAAPPRA